MFEPPFCGVFGLARLLLLERFDQFTRWESYFPLGRMLPSPVSFLNCEGFQMNDYDALFLHIPYGRDWDARRIVSLVCTKDLFLNCKSRSIATWECYSSHISQRKTTDFIATQRLPARCWSA